eukprot:c32509_g1_i1.p1 GENE.c32509_g1_i1~~c32509_g1_i1.p1  ORF type:complete len:753 (-),score=180.91 c32509_g1_i1:68-2326(-)
MFGLSSRSLIRCSRHVPRTVVPALTFSARFTSAVFHTRPHILTSTRLNHTKVETSDLTAVTNDTVQGWREAGLSSPEKARAVLEQITDLIDSDKSLESVDPEAVADLYWALFQKYKDNNALCSNLFTSLCQTLRIAPVLGDFLGDQEPLPIFFAHIQQHLASTTEPTPEDLERISALTDVITAFLDNDPERNLPIFAAHDMHRTFQTLMTKHSDDDIAASSMHALSAALTAESLEQVCSSLSDVLVHLSADRVYNHPATTEAALALLRQVASHRSLASTLDLKVLNLAVRAVRAHTKSFPIVDHALAFLAHMRSAYRDTGFPEGALTERDHTLTIIDAMQAHNEDPWIISAAFRYLMAIPGSDPNMLRIGMHHAKQLRALLKQHLNIADVQVYGCLAIAAIARANPLPMRKSGFTEHCDKVHAMFPKDTFIRNCASYLNHILTAESAEHMPVISGVPPEWDFTALGPGTLLKLEGNGQTVYLGGTPEKHFGEQERVHNTAQAILRGYDAVDDDDANFSDDGTAPTLDVNQPTTDDEVPDLELMDDDKDCSKAIAMTVEELTQLSRHPALARAGIEVTPEFGQEVAETIWAFQQEVEVLDNQEELADLEADVEAEMMNNFVEPVRHSLGDIKASLDKLHGYSASKPAPKWEEEALKPDELAARDFVLRQGNYVGEFAKGIEEYAKQANAANAAAAKAVAAQAKAEAEAEAARVKEIAAQAEAEAAKLEVAGSEPVTTEDGNTNNDATGQKPSA